MVDFPEEGTSQLRSKGWAVCEKRQRKYDPGRRACLGKGLKVGSLRERKGASQYSVRSFSLPSSKMGKKTGTQWVAPVFPCPLPTIPHIKGLRDQSLESCCWVLLPMGASWGWEGSPSTLLWLLP